MVSAGTRKRVAHYGWIRHESSPLQVAGCLTVCVGSDENEAAVAFGADLSSGVIVDPDVGVTSVDPLAGFVTVTETDQPTVIVVEDNGFQGSMSLPLEAASRRGRAASVFWNVDGLVVVSGARRGRMVFSGELGLLDVNDVPARMGPYVRLALDDESVDPVAVGAAMVETFTGVRLRPELLTIDRWYPLAPRFELPDPLSVADSGLGRYHPELAERLLAMPAPSRRRMADLVTCWVAERAGVVDQPAVETILSTLRTGGPATPTRALEQLFAEWERASSEVEERRDRALNGGWFDSPEAMFAAVDAGEFDPEDPHAGDPTLEEESASTRRWQAIDALSYACHPDEQTALLGTVHAAVTLFSTDGLLDVLTEQLLTLSALPPDQWERFVDLPAAPSAEERERAVIDARAEQRRAAHEERERAEWGLDPTDRIRVAGGSAQVLAWTEGGLLRLLDEQTDDDLLAVASWTALRMLAEADLLDRPWLADEVSALREARLRPADADRLDRLWGHLSADTHSEKGTSRRPTTLSWLDRVETFDIVEGMPKRTRVTIERAEIHPTKLPDDQRHGARVSKPHFALPLILVFDEPTPLAAASHAVSTALEIVDDRQSFIDELRSRFEVQEG